MPSMMLRNYILVMLIRPSRTKTERLSMVVLQWLKDNNIERLKEVGKMRCKAEWDDVMRPGVPNKLVCMVDAFRQEVPLDELAAGLRDTVVLAQRLGPRHLWVDALCIVQNDADDRARDARRMAIVYEHVVATVVALGTEHAGKGLFLSGGGTTPAPPLRTATLPCVLGKRGLAGYASLRVWPLDECESRDAAFVEVRARRCLLFGA